MILNCDTLTNIAKFILISLLWSAAFGLNKPLTRCVHPGVVAITFDDGPHNYTPSILDLLKQKNASATFFINGANFMSIYTEQAQAIILRTISEGHSMGSHTWTHSDLKNLTTEEIKYEMNQLTNELIRLEIWKHQPNFMRPPYGSFNDRVVDTMAELNYTMVNWSIDTWDWSHPGNTSAGMEEYVQMLNGTDSATTLGFIALHHDVQRGGVELASAAIDYVRNQGYRLVSLDECLGY